MELLFIQASNNKNIINNGYTMQTGGTPRPIVRNHNFRRIRFGNDPRDRDVRDRFRIQNRLFLF